MAGRPLAATFAPCRDHGNYRRPSPTPTNERTTCETSAQCGATCGWSAEARSGGTRYHATRRRRPFRPPKATANGAVYGAELLGKVPDMGPSGSHQTGIDLRKSAGPIPKPGRRNWRPGLELCDVTPSSITTYAAEGTGLEPATGFPAPHFQCASCSP